MIGPEQPLKNKGLRKALTQFIIQTPQEASPSKHPQAIPWDIFNLGGYLLQDKLKGFYSFFLMAILCFFIGGALSYFSQSLVSNPTTQTFKEAIEYWRESDSSIIQDFSFFIEFFDGSVYPIQKDEEMTVRAYMDYFYDQYKVDYPESFIMYGDSIGLTIDKFYSDANMFKFSKHQNMMNESSPLVCFSLKYLSWDSVNQVPGFPECDESLYGNSVMLWERKIIQMGDLCKGRSKPDCENLCEAESGVLIWEDGSRLCVSYFVLAAVCLGFDFSSGSPVFIQGCFSNQAMTYYIQAKPGVGYGLNLTLWMVRNIKDPYILAYELSSNYDVPMSIYNTSTILSIGETFFLSGSLLTITLVFGYFLILVVNEGKTIKSKVFQNGGAYVHLEEIDSE